MIYNQDDEENFLSDRKVGEVGFQETPRRRGGYVEPGKDDVKNIVPAHKKNLPVEKEEKQEKQESSTFENVVIVIAIIVIIIAAVIIFKVFLSSPKEYLFFIAKSPIKASKLPMSVGKPLIPLMQLPSH